MRPTNMKKDDGARVAEKHILKKGSPYARESFVSCCPFSCASSIILPASRISRCASTFSSVNFVIRSEKPSTVDWISLKTNRIDVEVLSLGFSGGFLSFVDETDEDEFRGAIFGGPRSVQSGCDFAGGLLFEDACIL